MKNKLFLMLLISLVIPFSGSIYAQNNDIITYELPLRFTFTPSSSSGLDKTSPAIPAGAFTAIKAYIQAGDVPWEISIPGKLTIQCPKNQVYPGNQVICRAWIESEDDPDATELSSNYGLSFGIKLIATDYIFGHEYEIGDFGKDFNLRINVNGKMPLGDNFLCGMDTVEYLSFPLDEFIPGSSSVGKTIKTLLSANDIAGGYDILSFNLAGEIVIEGKKVVLTIDGSPIELTGFRNKSLYPDPSNDPNVKTLSIPIPLNPEDDQRFDRESKAFMLNPLVGYNFNAYYTTGLQFTLVPGISFNIFPELVAKGTNPLTYSCPSPSTLHNPNYYGKAADDFYISSNIPLSVALPLTNTPDLPDLTITEVYLNRKPGARDAYIGEDTEIAFDIKNIGNKTTIQDPYWNQHINETFAFSVYIDGEVAKDAVGDPIIYRRVRPYSGWLVKTDPPAVLNINESLHINGMTHKFTTEGYHELKIGVGYLEYKGLADNKPVYGIGDYNRNNNWLVYGIYVYPPRGTVIGKIQTNPCYQDCGINGVTVCLRNTSGGNFNECLLSGFDQNKNQNGIYRFANVPTGDYVLEFLPPKPSDEELVQGAPYYAPKRFYFHHSGDSVDDFMNASGMYLTQYQTVKGKVVNENSQSLQGVEVSIGEFGTIKTVTDANGEFIFSNLLPGKEYKLFFRHPLYKTKVVTFTLSVFDSYSKDWNLTAGNIPYRDSDFSGDVYGFIKMTQDTTPPTLTIQPLDNKGFMGQELTFSFNSYDNDKNTYQYRYNIINAQGQKVFSSAWTNYPSDNTSVTIKKSLTFIDGEYYIIVQVKDQTGNARTSDPLLFKKDTTPPSFSMVLKDPVTGDETATDKKAIDVYINVNSTEPGELALYLSNDGNNWEFIRYFSGNTTTVKNWKILDDDFFHGTKTVYAKLVDLAGNEGTQTYNINVDNTGTVILAGGSCCFGSTHNVPLLFNVFPPEGQTKFFEYGTGGLTNIGDSDNTQYNAQKIVLNEAHTISMIKFYMYIPQEAVVGQPSPLNIKLIRNLSNKDPQSSDPNNTILSWRFAYTDVLYLLNKYYGYLHLNIEPALIMTPGTYYLLVYTDDVSEGSYYTKATGYYYSLNESDRQNHMRYRYNPSTGSWVEESEPNNGPIYTLSYQALYSPPGQIKIAPDGNCDNPNWQWVNHEKNLLRHIDLPHDGLNTVCVQYYNPISSERDGKYYASILIDTGAPTGTVTYSVDRDTKTIYFNVNATDELTEVKQIRYTLPTGYSDIIGYSSTIKVGKNTPLTNLFSLLSKVQGISFSFIDKVGNESQPYYVAINEADDIFPPEVQIAVNNNNPYTNNTNVRIDIAAKDNFNLKKITIKEQRTGKTWTIPETGTLSGQTYSGSIDISIPSITVDGNQVIHDGIYDFIAYAEDAQGNVSRYTDIKRLILDREPPDISSILITDLEGKSYTTQQYIILKVQVVKDLTPLTMRYRFKPDGAWSQFMTIYPGITSINITGPVPMPVFYMLDVEVRDGAGNTTVKEAAIRTNRRPNRPDDIMLSTIYSTTPRMSIDYSDPDNDPFLGASFVIRDTTGAIVYSTGIINSPSFDVPPGFLSYNTPYTVTGYVVDSYNLSSPYRYIDFTLKKPKLTVSKTGEGTVSTEDNTINCGSLCESEFDYMATVTLKATASAGWKFSQWTGDCSLCGTSDTCIVLINYDKTCGATFLPAPAFTLSTLKDNTYTSNDTINIYGVVSNISYVKELTIKGAPIQINADGSFSHAVRLTNGANTIDITMEDTSGNKTTETRTIHCDPDAPVVNITSPSDNMITNEPNVIIAGTVNSANTVSISLNDNPAQTVNLSEGAFSHNVTLSPGMNTLYITATDTSSGKTSTVKRTVIYDNTKPSVAVTYPAQDITTNQNTIILKGEVSNTQVITVSIEIEGTTYTPNVTSGAFEIPVTLDQEKTYPITVTATDLAGNTSTVTRNIIYDTTSQIGEYVYYMPLTSGWNFISLPVQPTDNNIQTVLSNISSSVRVVWGYDNENKVWLKYNPSTSSGSLTTMDAGKGYWIYMNNPATLTLTGGEPSSPITLYKGWNLIGWNGTDGQTVETALSSIADKWIIIWGWENGQWKAKIKDSNLPLGVESLATLDKGKAYWINVSEGVNWGQ